jgi:hypothetical protein
MTDSEYLALLALAPTGSLVLVGLLFFHRDRVYAAWAKIASIIAFIAGVGWGVLGFVLMHWRSYHLTRNTYYTLVGIKGVLCGIAIAFSLCILIARPYQKRDVATPEV